jgi:hypothetical protein
MGFFASLGALFRDSEHLSRGVGDAIGKAGENIVAIHRTVHESSRLAAQQEFLATLPGARRTYETGRAGRDARHGRKAVRRPHRHRPADRTEEGRPRQAAGEPPQTACRHRDDEETHRAHCEPLARELIHRRVPETGDSPFAHDEDRTRDLVAAATDGGRRPALLIAPCLGDTGAAADARSAEACADGDETPTRCLPLTDAMRGAPWDRDLGRTTGIVRRPLRRADTDVPAIRAVLHDLPVVLVYGTVESDRRVRVHLVAWNLDTGTPAGDAPQPPAPGPGTAPGAGPDLAPPAGPAAGTAAPTRTEPLPVPFRPAPAPDDAFPARAPWHTAPPATEIPAAVRLVLPFTLPAAEGAADGTETGTATGAGAAEGDAFRAGAARAAALCAAVLAEWFHVARGDRVPELHERLPAAPGEPRTTAGAGSAAMLDIAAARGLLAPEQALLEQAETLLTAGLPDRAAETAREAATRLGRELGPRYTDYAARLVRVLDALGEHSGAAAVRRAAEPVARQEVRELYG